MATQVEKPSLDDELLERLLAGRDPKTVLESDGLLGELKKALAQRMLNAEMDVHLIRYSMPFASWKERKAIAAGLKLVYRAADPDAARAALDTFGEGPWGRKYPAIAQSWRRHWAQVIPFFAFSPDIRRVIYTTNAIESPNSEVRKAIRNKGHFPNDEAATKLIWLALQNVSAKWKSPPIYWHAAKAQLAIQFEERFVLNN